MARRNGTTGNDVFQPLAEDNESYGGLGNDIFFDGSHNDLMDGGAGNDTFVMMGEGNGINTIHGGDGIDTLDYSRVETGIDGPSIAPHISHYGVFVDLQAGMGDWFGSSTAQADHFDGIENVTGSKFDDVINTNDSANVIRAGAGDDWMVDFGTGDTLDGGDGIDYVSYAYSAAGVTIDLLAGTASGGSATGDSLRSVEGVIGSAYNDRLSGTKGGDLMHGNSGRDVLDGRGGDDILDGGIGRDVVNGGDGNDRVSGGWDIDQDVLTGGAGRDTFQFVRGSNDGARGDIITDFEAGVDTLEIAQATAATTHYSFFGGINSGTLTITFDNSDQSLVLEDISAFESNLIISGDIEFV